MAYTHEPTDPRVRRHCETLARRAWQVFQIGLAAEGEAAVGRLNGVLLVRRRRRRYRGGRLISYAIAYFSFALWARRILKRLARRRRIDVVQANNLPNFIVWTALPARRRGARVVLDIHDPVPELFLSKFGRRPGSTLAARLLALDERLAARWADEVLCVNEPHRDVTTAHGVRGDRLRLVVNAPDRELFPHRSPRIPSPYVAFHGTVAARMGLDVVLEALAMLRQGGLQVTAAFWGDGDAVADLRSLRDRLGLSDAVEIPGQRFRLESLAGMLEEVGIGLVPMARDQYTDLVLPTKLLEYVRLGLPVVASWTPTIAHYFSEDSLVFVREFSAAGVARALRHTLTTPEEARARAIRAQTLPIARSWQEIEQAFVDIIEGVGKVA